MIVGHLVSVTLTAGYFISDSLLHLLRILLAESLAIIMKLFHVGDLNPYRLQMLFYLLVNVPVHHGYQG